MYDESGLLDTIAAIRKRPGMYVADRSARGLVHLLHGVIGGAVEEHRSGRAAMLRVTFEGATVEVAHDGAGALDGSPEIRPLHIYGIFDERIEPGVRGFGFNAVILAALTRRLEVECVRDGRRWRQVLERGRASGPAFDLGESDRVGTSLRFLPDDEVFETLAWDKAGVREVLWELACLNPSLAVVLDGATMRAPTGLRELVRRRALGTTAGHDRIVHIIGAHEGIDVEVALLWTDGESTCRGFANQHAAHEGTHVDGLWAGLTSHLGLDIPVGVARELLEPGLVAAVQVVGSELSLDASRLRLRTPDARAAVETVVAEALPRSWQADPSLAALIEARLHGAGVRASLAQHAAGKGSS